MVGIRVVRNYSAAGSAQNALVEVPAVKSVSVLIRIAEFHAHLGKDIPSPLVVIEQLSGVIKSPFIHNSLVIWADCSERTVGDHHVNIIAKGKILICIILHISPKRIIIINVLIYGIVKTLDGKVGECVCFTWVKIRRISAEYQVCYSVISLTPFYFDPIDFTSILLLEGVISGIHNFIFAVVLEWIIP